MQGRRTKWTKGAECREGAPGRRGACVGMRPSREGGHGVAGTAFREKAQSTGCRSRQVLGAAVGAAARHWRAPPQRRCRLPGLSDGPLRPSPALTASTVAASGIQSFSRLQEKEKGEFSRHGAALMVAYWRGWATRRWRPLQARPLQRKAAVPLRAARAAGAPAPHLAGPQHDEGCHAAACSPCAPAPQLAGPQHDEGEHRAQHELAGGAL